MNANSNNLNYIDQNESEIYSSDIFSKLPYEDLKKAHIESVVPVTEDDYENVLKFKNVDECKNMRSKPVNPLSVEELNSFIREKEKNEQEINNNRAYQLIKQGEIYNEQRKKVLSKVKLLK